MQAKITQIITISKSKITIKKAVKTYITAFFDAKKLHRIFCKKIAKKLLTIVFINVIIIEHLLWGYSSAG